MKKLILLIALFSSSTAWTQVPTFRWVSGSQESREKSSLVKTEIGPRQGAASFTDADGNFWVFGGNGQDFIGNRGFFNDTWKYDRSSGIWEWIGGQMSTDQPLSEINNSLTFNGTNNIIQLADDPLDYTQNLTIELWFKPTQDGVIMSFSRTDQMDDWNGWRFETVSNGETFWLLRDGFVEAQITGLNLIDGNWHHLAVTYKNAEGLFESRQLTITLDGNETVLANRRLLDEDSDVSSHVTYIGGFRGDNEEIFFTGQIDEVRFWDRAKNYGEIVSNKDIELSGTEDSLRSYYKFNQGIANSNGNSESELIDETGNYNGALGDDFFRSGVFIGQMAEVRVWNYFLGVDEIQAAANNTISGAEAGLLAGYDFTNGIPEADNTLIGTVPDQTVNGLDGSFQNFDLQGTLSNYIQSNLELIPVSYQNRSGGVISAMGDFDGDTYEDIVTTTYNNSISVLLNDQAGGLGAYTEFDVSTYPRGLTTGYLNSDSHLDIAVAGWNNGVDDVVRVFFGDGTGDFPTFIDIDPGDNTRPESITSGDLNGDTFEDLVVGNRESHEVNIYLSDGTGGFGTPTTFTVEWLYAQNIIIEDVNNDTHPDIVTGSIYDNNRGRLSLYINDGTGTFTDQSIDNFAYVENLYPVDINTDGNLDFIFRNGWFVGILTGNGDGTFERSLETNLQIDLGDMVPLGFEGDNLRFLAPGRFQNKYQLYDVSPEAEFTLIKEFNTQFNAGNLHVLDFDKDGIEDLVISEASDRVNIMLRENSNFNRNATVNGMDFDGVDDYIDYQDLRPFDNSFTWEGWIKTEDNGPLFSFTSNNPLSEWNSGHFSLAIKEGALTFLVFGGPEIIADNSKILTDNEWHHIAMTVSINGSGNETVVLYIDGYEAVYDGWNDFDGLIDFSNTGNSSKAGYASGDFKSVIVTTSQSPNSNWVDGVDFPGPVNGRAYTAHWTDAAGEFYTFAGQGENGLFNSIRQFDKNTETWITIKGIDQAGEPGNYGTINVSDPANIPPIRFGTEAAVDTNGDVWIFGGIADNENTSYYNDLWKYDPLLNEWVWVSGSSTTNQTPVYGTQGVSDPANVPGAREHHKMWSDSNGNVWLFGGYGYDTNGDLGYLNDIWRFEVSTSSWTWIGGSDQIDQGGSYGEIDVYDAGNFPGARAASLQWIDGTGRVWLFGGIGYDKFGLSVDILNDLWSYNPNTSEWAWHSGSDFANSTGSYNQPGLSSVDYVPGARRYSNGWVDEEDNLWLFGGFLQNQITTGLYNDFWKYEPATREWTWISGFDGTALSNQLGTYGDIGAGSVPHPGERHGGLVWTDLDGDFWILGGASLGSSSYGFYNDLWEYESQKDQWTYHGGSTSLIINDGEYGSKGIGSSLNEPRARWHGASWTGDDGKLWFFGGIHHNKETDGIGWLNDLWFYDPESDVYTWMGGDSDVGAAGVYGTRGQSSAGHIPGARSSSSYWKDHDGNFWLFGGYESFEYNNDLWKFDPNTLEWTWVSGNNFQNTPGTYGELGVPSPDNIIGARRYTDARMDQDGNVWIYGGNGIDSQAQLAWLSDLWKYNPVDNTWTWMSGSTEINTPGTFGVKGVASPDNQPPPRYGHASWIDDSGNVWIFGGFGLLGEGEDQTSGQLNDLWKFDVRTSMWTWMGGSDTFNATGTFGVQGVFDELNEIPAKARAQVFETYDKSLWIFGGRQGTVTSFNDFWQIRFTPGLPLVETPYEIGQEQFSFSYDEPWARQYEVQVALTDDFSDVFFTQSVEDPAITVPGLQPGTNYYYRVEASNEIGGSGFTPGDPVLTLPSTPTFESLEAALSDLTPTQVYLDWEVTEGILDGYYMDVSQDPAFEDPDMVHEDFESKAIPVGQRQEILSLIPGTQYYARLQSYNASGVSPFSMTVPFLTQPATPTYDMETVVTEVSQSSALVTWNEVPEILAGYRITVSTLDDGHTDSTAFLADYTSLNINKSRNSIQINGLEPGTNYFAYLVAVNMSGPSDLSEKITILTTPASPVFNLETAILDISQNEITFNWEAPQGFFEGYELQVSIDQSFVNTNLMLEGYGRGDVPFELGQGDLTTAVSGLMPGQTYYARIRAFNSAGESPYSNILTFTTVPRAPALGQVNNITQGEAAINWQSTPGTELYLIDLNESEGFEEASSIFANFPLAVPFQVLDELKSGTRYYVRVQSSNSSGNSGDMNPADYGQTNFITIPATPELAEIEYGQTSVRIHWEDIEGAANYEVDASENFFLSFLDGFNGLSVNDSEVEITGLDPGSEYQIRVRASNESGNSPNAQILDLLTLPGTPVARDASNSSASVFTANWDPSDGADFYVLEVSLDDFQTFHYNEQLSSSNPVKIENLVGGETYKYRVKAGNESGESTYSNEISVIAQNTAQSLDISEVEYNDEFGETSTLVPITVRLTGGLGNPNVTIRHKEILSNEWTEFLPMNEVSPTEFTYTILPNMLDEIGVVFEIYADDGVTFIRQLNNIVKRTFTETSSEALPDLELGSWSMISIPYILEDNLVTSIFNELGDLEYKKRWRLMTYLDGEYQDQGVGFTRMELGRGYWFNSLTDVTISVGAGETNSTIPFEMPLEQGWNQIGNPYNVRINWDEILDDNALTVGIGKVIVYDLEEQVFKESSTLGSFEGAFVFADQATVLSVSPISTPPGGRRARKSEAEEFAGRNWKQSIMINTGGTRTEIAAIGMHEEASYSKDRFDKMVVPRFANYLEMYTTNEEYFYPKFRQDIIAPAKENSWEFNLTSNYATGYTILEWDPAQLGSNGYLWLVDEKAGRIIEMHDQTSYSFNFDGDRKFTVHYSLDPDYTITPSQLTLGDAYPNPVNSRAYIPIFLPESNQRFSLRLDLFDMQGRLVKTIANGEFNAGIHVFELDIEDDTLLRDGLYFYKASFGSDQLGEQQKKIFIKR